MKFYKRIRKFLVLLCVFTSINTSIIYADINKHFNFKNMTIEDGLSQSTVETIFQDSKGYIWFGTNDGLDRYNGYEFKHYKFDKYDKNSLPNNYIVDIIEDKYGYLWISTIAGLSRINPETDEIKNYYTDKNNGNLSDSNLWQLLYTKDNKLIASTVNGLNVYDEKNDTFTRVLGNEMRKLTTVDSVECKSNFCPYKDKCFYTLHRKKAQHAKVVVTNYHMLFSCMNANSSVFNDASLIVFDEAHEAEDILREFNASQVSIGTVEYIEKKIKEIENKLGRKNEILGIENTEKLSNYAKEFFKGIEERYEKTIYLRAKIIDSQKDLPDSENLVFMLNDTIRRLKKVKLNVEQVLDIEGQNQNNDNTPKDDGGNEDFKSALVVTKTLITTIENMVEMIYRVDDILQDKNIVMWVEIEKGVVVLGKKSIDVSQTFKRYFLEKEEDGVEKTCILTSATISVDGNFEYLKNNLGFNLIDKDKVVEFMGKSPFDLTNQELWYLPKDAVPGNDENFEATMTNQIEKIIKATDGGVLCLFTSNRNLGLCKRELLKKNIGHKIYAQGDMGRNKLTELFKEDYHSTLLATKSFFTGIDIPGQSLRCIVIDKLPFTSPGDPVNQKLKMRPNYFARFMLPQMIITLKQAVGRGVRSVDDKCVICILDERLSTATYKNKVLSSFKYKKTATRSLDRVKSFIENNK